MNELRWTRFYLVVETGETFLGAENYEDFLKKVSKFQDNLNLPPSDEIRVWAIAFWEEHHILEVFKKHDDTYESKFWNNQGKTYCKAELNLEMFLNWSK